MKRYDAYKDIEFAAIPSIPTHWDVKKFRHIARFTQRKNRDAVDRPMLSLSAYRGVEIKHYDDENMARTKEESFEYCIVKPNQLVINPMWVIYGAIGVSKYHGIVSPAYRVYSLSNDIVPLYCDYLLKSHFYIKDYNRYIRGLTTYDRSVRKEDFHEILVLLPPRAEQNAIVALLDHKLAEIDRFIANKKRLIELLKEQKAALINRAVTRGIEPDVLMKPSGIEWLGEIPAHWEVRKIKHLAKMQRGIFSHRPRNDPRMYDGPYPFIQTGDVRSANKYIKSYQQTLNEAGLAVSKNVPKGTLVMTIAANVADVGILDFDACIPDSLVGFIPHKMILIDYLFYLLMSMREELLKTAPINTQLNLNVERIGALWTIVPPFYEQSQIITYIERETTRIDVAITTIEREIELIKEYRTTLISEAVTGKIDVRTAHREELPVEAGRSSHHELERYVGNGPRGSD